MMQTSLEAISNKAKRMPRYRFQNLYGMINEKSLALSWKRLNPKAAVGVDQITHAQFGEGLENKVKRIVENLKRKRYRAKLVRRKNIPKPNGKLRPLGIPAMEDKVLQYAVKQILEAIYESDFLPSSFGYRPKRGALDAMKELCRTLQNGRYFHVVEADIKGYFDNIDHDWLLRMLGQRIDDKSFLWLIKKWLKAGILEEDGRVIHPVTGSPQGGIISPVLANIYMHYVLNLWFEKVVKRHCKGKAYICVYADDFVCAFENRTDAERFYKVLWKRFRKFGLELSEEKTNIINFNPWNKENGAIEFLGFELKWDRKLRKYLRLKTCKKKFQNSVRQFKEWIKRYRSVKLRKLMYHLNAKLRGYYNYYGLKRNYASIDKFHFYAMKLLYKWLNRRSQKYSYRGKGFKQMLFYYRIEKPRIVTVW